MQSEVPECSEIESEIERRIPLVSLKHLHAGSKAEIHRYRNIADLIEVIFNSDRYYNTEICLHTVIE